MNNRRRKDITEISDKIAALADILNEYMADVESIKEEEEEYFDNMPESLQGGEKGSAAEEAVDALEEACSALVQMIDSLDEVTSGLEAASQ